ncbi:hypothetical protein JG687_00014539 [Phytophthora cactorum]|uniref:ZSWIM1/3 RNaseH-like domain-containing protein n=1 Tax=Phytophthora cactorum TaxID=29920 RepID=A0A8T1TWA9_9STRA|nr:hypothetical protein JG687_00014539 [Phytophthora cactorum]
MRAMFEQFPEVLQMDCTHKTNKYNCQLFSMVAMDQFLPRATCAILFVGDDF